MKARSRTITTLETVSPAWWILLRGRSRLLLIISTGLPRKSHRREPSVTLMTTLIGGRARRFPDKRPSTTATTTRTARHRSRKGRRRYPSRMIRSNRRSSLTLPNGVVISYGYDDGSELTGLTYTLGTTTLGNLMYSYDSDGRRISMGGSYARRSCLLQSVLPPITLATNSLSGARHRSTTTVTGEVVPPLVET